MADAPTLSPEVSRGVSTLARTLVAAARSWALYPPDHPAVRGSLDRLRSGITESSGGQIFTFGVTPDTLLVAGIAVGGRDAGAIAEAARWLHDRDILQMTFTGEIPVATLQKLLSVLSEDSRVIRRRDLGGLADQGAADRLNGEAQLVERQAGPEAWNGLQLVERTAGMAEPAARHHRHGCPAGGRQRRKD